MTSVTLTGSNSGLLKKVAQFFVELNEKRIHQKNIHITIKQLSALSDRELNDMGISRGDIWAVANGDPSYQRTGSKPNPNLTGWV